MAATILFCSDSVCAYIPLLTRSRFFSSKQKRKEKGKHKNVYLLTVTEMRVYCLCVKSALLWIINFGTTDTILFSFEF